MLEEIIAVLANYKELDPATLNADTSFKELGLDSLDMVEISMELEDKLDVTIELENEVDTIGKFAEYLTKLKKA